MSTFLLVLIIPLDANIKVRLRLRPML
jgi:hypothetical protein